MFLAVMAIFSCFICISLSNFFQYEVVTKIVQVEETASEFPAVTFCTGRYNLVNETMVQQAYSVYVVGGADLYEAEYRSKFINSEIYNRYRTQDIKITDGIYDKIVLLCKFQQANCSMHDFKVIADISPTLGVCFSFNYRMGENVRTVETISSTNGLQLILYLGEHEEHEAFSTNGGTLIIHDSNTKPIWTDGIAVAAGFNTKIAVSRTKDVKLGAPYNVCKDLKTIDDHDSQAYKDTFKENYSYKKKYYFFSFCVNTFKTSFFNPLDKCQL